LITTPIFLGTKFLLEPVLVHSLILSQQQQLQVKEAFPTGPIDDVIDEVPVEDNGNNNNNIIPNPAILTLQTV
jgi:hypothetical protein